MNLDAITARMVALGLGEPGKTIFQNSMPADCMAGIMLRTPLTGIPIDHELPNYYRGSLQMIVRSHQHASGEALAKQLLEGFKLYNTELLDQDGRGVRIKFMLPQTLPIVYRRSDGNGIEWSINFDVVYTSVG